MDLLTALVDKSLVGVDEREGRTRYSMLETVREYAGERLVGAPDAEETRRAHLAHYVALTAPAAREITGPDQVAWLALLEAEHDNLRAALGYALDGSDPEAGLAITGSVWRFWYVRGHLVDGRQWLARALASGAGEPAARAQSLNGAGSLARAQGDFRRARSFHEEALEVLRAVGDKQGIAYTLSNLGNLARAQGDFSLARVLGEESLAIVRELGDTPGIAYALSNLAMLAQDLGDHVRALALEEEALAVFRHREDGQGIAYSLLGLGAASHALGDSPRALALFDEALAVFRELGDKAGIAYSLLNLGMVARVQGDFPLARARYDESLGLFLGIGNKRGVAFSLEEFASLAADIGQALRAAVLFGAAEVLREEIGASILPPTERADHERALARARAAAPDPEAFERAWTEGRALGEDDAIRLALESDDGS